VSIPSWAADLFTESVTRYVLPKARDLRSDHGENQEYDRALVELTMALLGYDEDGRSEVYALLNIIEPVEPEHVLVLTMRNYLDKRATCRCGWESSRKDRRVEATMAWETHAGLREDPDTAVTR